MYLQIYLSSSMAASPSAAGCPDEQSPALQDYIGAGLSFAGNKNNALRVGLAGEC